jgi:hypothetical protein
MKDRQGMKFVNDANDDVIIDTVISAKGRSQRPSNDTVTNIVEG